MNKKKVIGFTILAVVLAFLISGSIFIFRGTTERGHKVADAEALKIDEDLFYYRENNPDMFDVVTAQAHGKMLTIEVGLADGIKAKKNFATRIELTKISYHLAKIQRQNNIKGTVFVFFTDEYGTVVAVSPNLYQPVHFIADDDETYDMW